jgi:predicted Zn-dependent peptidase
MKRPSPTLFLLAALAVGCARTMVMAPAPAPMPERPIQEAVEDAVQDAVRDSPQPPVQSPAEAPDLGLDDAIPIDPAILTGRLDNGLTYFVRHNGEPPDRVELRLVVNAGSVLEDADQLGLAHFVEHMAFNGTRNFAEGELVDYFEGIGLQFGADLNASTGFDETVYSLRVPAEPDLLERGFEVLADWAGGILFEPEAVDRERDVVIEEWRLGRGAGARIRDRQLPLLFRGSRYADRLPIGTPEILESAPVETLRRFYRDWYRPELMAVVAVGDYEPTALEQWIRDEFADLETPVDPRPRPLVPVPGHAETLVGVTTDPEVTVTSVGVYTKLGSRPEGTVADYRRQLAEGLYHSMLNRRLDELRRRPEPPFLWASSSTGGFVRASDVYVQSAGVRSGELLGGLSALLTEIERVDRHGFTEGELTEPAASCCAPTSADSPSATRRRRSPTPANTPATTWSASRRRESRLSSTWSDATCRPSSWPSSTGWRRSGSPRRTAWCWSPRRNRRATACPPSRHCWRPWRRPTSRHPGPGWTGSAIGRW